MPKIDVSRAVLERLSGIRISNKILEAAKASIDEENGDFLKLSIEDTNRPDLWSVEGIARAVSSYKKCSGAPKIEITKSGKKLIVDANVKKIRPFISCFIAKNANITDEFLIEMIQLQEKLAENFGRKRQRVSIGLYDCKKLGFPLYYKAIDKNTKFIPLGHSEEMPLIEILEKHEKGMAYKHIIEAHRLFPVFFDINREILSLVPIINSAKAGRLGIGKTDILVESTGTDINACLLVSSILAYAFYDRDCKIESIKIEYPWSTPYGKSIETPLLKKQKIEFEKRMIEKLLGIRLSDAETKKLLEKMMYNVTMKKHTITAEYPSFRNDIMHAVDAIEDIAIAYGYDKIKSKGIESFSIGGLEEKTRKNNLIKRIMICLGFQEILSPILSGRRHLTEEMETNEEIIEIENVMNENYSAVRNKILPSLLSCLTKSMHYEYPQKIFELGECAVLDKSTQDGTKTITNLACCISSALAGYEDISSVFAAFMSGFGIEYKFVRTIYPSFIEGRTAEIYVKNKVIGFIGEVHPKVLNNCGIERPVVVFEVNVDDI